MYLVKWTGFVVPTWETKEDLNHSRTAYKVYEAFVQEHGDAGDVVPEGTQPPEVREALEHVY